MSTAGGGSRRRNSEEKRRSGVPRRYEDQDSGFSSSSQRDDVDDDVTLAKSVVSPTRSDKDNSRAIANHHSPSSPDSILSSFSSLSPSYSGAGGSRMVMIPRCAAPRDRVISKYPPPFHPDATPNVRINFHTAVKKACLSHHSKVLSMFLCISSSCMH